MSSSDSISRAPPSADDHSRLVGADGADKFVGGGRPMEGLGGDDLYFVRSAADVVIEAAGGGSDTVIASNLRAYVLADNVETLVINGNAWGTGNAADNTLVGGNASQTLHGAGGDDLLSGGLGRDTFIFEDHGGRDVIIDFEAGDHIRLAGHTLVNYAQVQAAMTQDGADVLLTLSAADSVRILNAKVADLGAADFQFTIDASRLTQTFAEDFNGLDLADSATGLGGRWATSFDFGPREGLKSLAAHTLLNNDEQQIYVDSGYAGRAAKGSEGLGLNPFSTSDGVLTITAQKVAGPQAELFNMEYTSGLLTTENSFYQKYGYFEMSAALPSGQGAWPAFWLLPKDGTNPLELDVMEAIGGDMAYQTSHFNAEGLKSKESFANYVADAGAFHSYGMLWTAQEIAWYIDNVEVASMATPEDLNRPMYILANLAVGGNWSGRATFDSAEMKIDSIRAYEVDADATSATINVADTAAPGRDQPNVLVGGVGADVLSGGVGRDIIRGLGGDDVLDGGRGRDTLVGGAGADRLTGGGGQDVFLFRNVSDSTAASSDTIVDFNSAQKDRIDLSAIDADTGSAADDGFRFVGSAMFSGHAGELRFETHGADAVVFADVDGDGHADFVLNLASVASLSAGDFIL